MGGRAGGGASAGMGKVSATQRLRKHLNSITEHDFDMWTSITPGGSYYGVKSNIMSSKDKAKVKKLGATFDRKRKTWVFKVNNYKELQQLADALK